MKISQLLFISVCLITASCTPKKEADKKADTYEVVNPILTIMKMLSSPRKMKDTVREAVERGRSNI